MNVYNKLIINNELSFNLIGNQLVLNNFVIFKHVCQKDLKDVGWRRDFLHLLLNLLLIQFVKAAKC